MSRSRSADRRSAVQPPADPAALRSGDGRRRRSDGERARARVSDFIFVPTLVSLLRNRRLKGRARAALVAYGEPVGRLAGVLPQGSGGRDLGPAPHSRDARPDSVAEDRRRPRRRARENATGSSATRWSRHSSACGASILSSTSARESIEALAVQEARRYLNFLSLHDNLFGKEKLPRTRCCPGARSSR